VPSIPHLFWYALRKVTATLLANVIDTGTGVVLIYQSTHLNNIWYSFKPILGIPYFSVSISLNVLLTLIIVTRLILHSRSVGSALGPLVRPSRLYNAIVTILIESSALYALFSLLFIATWATKTRAIGLFLPILAETQVRSITL
jgi:hypothetical protein